MKHFKKIQVNELVSLACDTCGQQATKGEYEFFEFISIHHQCSYGSIHGDGNQVSIDLCQQCFADMCGDALSVTSMLDDKSGMDKVMANKTLGKAKGMLSGIQINSDFDDDSSCQSSIDNEHNS